MNECPCSRPTQDFLCGECVGGLLKDLRGVPDLLVELTTTGAKLDVTGTRGGGGSSERPIGVNIGALELKGTLEHLLLAMWMRVGLTPAKQHPIEYVEGIVSRIHVLAGHKSAVSYRDQLNAEVKRGWELIDLPKHIIRLGKCTTEECGDDITALDGHTDTRCQTCGTDYNVTELRQHQRGTALDFLDDKTGTAPQISRIMQSFGVPFSPNRIKTWKDRAKISPIGKNLQGQDIYIFRDARNNLTKAHTLILETAIKGAA